MHSSFASPTGMTVLCASFLAASCGSAGYDPDAGPDAGPPRPGTYENVVSIFETSCNFSSCHGGTGPGGARLNLAASIAAGTLVADLERPACQYDAMPLLTPGDPTRSWLYLKVAGPHAGARLDFTPSPAWDPGISPDAMGRYPASECPLTERGEITFGTLMPQGSMGLDASRTATIRMWIEAGAPGPA